MDERYTIGRLGSVIQRHVFEGSKFMCNAIDRADVWQRIRASLEVQS